MKQMIKNHREIETLEDFIYYDKASGKIKIKKELDLAVPIPTGKTIYKHSIKCTNSDDDDYWFVLYTTSNEKLETIAKIAEVMRIASLGGNNYNHYAVNGFMNTNGNYFSVNTGETAIVKGIAINSLSAGSYPVTTIVDTVTEL